MVKAMNEQAAGKTVPAGPPRKKGRLAAGCLVVLMLIGISVFVLVPGGLALFIGAPPVAGGPPGEMVTQVVAARAEARRLADSVELVGNLESPDAFSLVSEVDAKIEDIRFKEGDRVEAGQILIAFDQRRLKAQLNDAEARFTLAKTNFERSTGLLESETISQQEFDEASASYHSAQARLILAQEEFDDSLVTAPFAGVMGERLVSAGQFAGRQTPLARIVRTDPLDVVCGVPERYMERLKPGVDMIFKTAAFPERTFTGTITYIAPEVDTQTRTIRVKAKLVNSDGMLRPGMFGRAEVVLGMLDEAVVVPEAAVTFSGRGATLVAVSPDGISEIRPVTVGRHLNDGIHIAHGLEAGEIVVVEGGQKLAPGGKVMFAPESKAHGVDPTPPPAAPEH